MEPVEHVCCADCGFLGLRNRAKGSLDEANERFRKEAFFAGSPPIHDPLPICAKRVINFRDEANPGIQPEILQAIRKERRCEKFTKWQVGSNPKEHQEMILQVELLRLQNEQRESERRFQGEQRAADLERQKSQREEDLRRQEEHSRRQEEQRQKDQSREDKQRTRDKLWGVALIILAAAVGLLFDPVKTWLNRALGITQSAPAVQKQP